MKNIQMIAVFICLSLLISCGTTRGITVEEAKPHWDVFYNELITTCLNTKGKKLIKPPIKSKPYFYSCVVQRRARQTATSSYSLESPFHGHIRGENKMLSGRLNNYLMTKFNTGEFFSRHSIQDYNKYWYSQWILKNGYTLFSFGQDDPFDKKWRRYIGVKFARVEGYSLNEYPTEGEILGTKNDVPDNLVKPLVDKLRKQIKSQVRQEKNINARVSARTNAILAERERRRRQRNREIRESNRRHFQEFYMNTVGAMRSGPIVKSMANYSSTSNRTSSSSRSIKRNNFVNNRSAPAKAKVPRCSPSDYDCKPDVWILCRDMTSVFGNFRCESLKAEYVRGLWSMNGQLQGFCRRALGKNAENHRTFSRNGAFVGSAPYLSNNPKQACVQYCSKEAQKPGYKNSKCEGAGKRR